MKKALNLIFLDDNCGYGDLIGCCPACYQPFNVPIEVQFSKDFTEYPCAVCGQMIKISTKNP